MQKRLAIGQGVKILDQKSEGGGVQRPPPPASLRVNTFSINTLGESGLSDKLQVRSE